MLFKLLFGRSSQNDAINPKEMANNKLKNFSTTHPYDIK